MDKLINDLTLASTILLTNAIVYAALAIVIYVFY